MNSKDNSLVAIPRRRLLVSLGLGSAALAAPLLPLFSASGQEARRPKRLLLFYTPDGICARTRWQPIGSERDFTLNETVHAPLNDFRGQLVVPFGLRSSEGGDGEAHGRGLGGLWTGSAVRDVDGTKWASGPSIDQLVAAAHGPNCPYERSAGEALPETAFRSLEVGAGCGGANETGRMIYRGARQPLHPEESPAAFFDRVFGRTLGLDEEHLARYRRERRSVLDISTRQLSELRRKLSSSEHEKLDAHLEALRSIERGLEAPVSNSCEVPARPADGDEYRDAANFPEYAKTMIDLTVRALACDATRVASIQLSRCFSQLRHHWAGVPDHRHHHVSHYEGPDRDTVRALGERIDAWYATQFAYLLGEMAKIPESGGTLLDNTLVVWGRELGTASHGRGNMPFFLAGSGRGSIRTGRSLVYTGQPHASLLVSVGRAMGLESLESIGDVDPESGGLSDLL